MTATIFVFGCNLAGRHGKGSALTALNHHGAVYGQPYGRQGNSFGIPTKDYDLKILSLADIQLWVNMFLAHARNRPDDVFNVVAIGCGLAGYNASQIAPMFSEAPSNVKLPKEFLAELGHEVLETPSLFDTTVDDVL